MARLISSSQYLEFAHQLYEELNSSEMNLVYVGGVTQDITRNFSLMTEENLIRHKESNPVQRKVFNVMVESLQNISRHAEVMPGDPEGVKRGVILISHNDQTYNIVTGNLMLAANKQKLQDRLDSVNAMDKPQLSEAYKKQILEGEIGEHGGAGLGFIDICKKSGRKIDYRFYELDGQPDYLFFMTVVTVGR